ncbi:hypothetical protein F7725_018022 [Dissostichus mawsoni]|uniref:Uncharacterized protein n=1 Tax=Dissostichus mawsoni TaxID=36200 RepID=A0A7J5XQB4_DISMA|nr:hypothetical protein F7725_018022 [Dissostichus mawsoni]
MWTKQTYYDQGEKADKLLAWRVKKMQAERIINSIKSVSGNLTADPKEIHNHFRDFYKSVYKSEYTENRAAQSNVLDQLQFHTLGSSISDLNSVTSCNLRAAVQPEERERGSRGGAGQTDGAVELHQLCAAGAIARFLSSRDPVDMKKVILPSYSGAVKLLTFQDFSQGLFSNDLCLSPGLTEGAVCCQTVL